MPTIKIIAGIRPKQRPTDFVDCLPLPACLPACHSFLFEALKSSFLVDSWSTWTASLARFHPLAFLVSLFQVSFFFLVQILESNDNLQLLTLVTVQGLVPACPHSAHPCLPSSIYPPPRITRQTTRCCRFAVGNNSTLDRLTACFLEIVTLGFAVASGSPRP
jgi:hypothetical protein